MLEILGLDQLSAADIITDFKEHCRGPLVEFAAQIASKNLAGERDAKPAPQVCKSANDAFRLAFPEGFAMEVTDVVCGPPAPVAVFKFRHVAKFSGTYTDSAGNAYGGVGQIIDIQGMCEARLQMGTYEVTQCDPFYNPPDLIQCMTGERDSSSQLCPMSGRAGVCPVIGIVGARDGDAAKYEEMMHGKTPTEAPSRKLAEPLDEEDAAPLLQNPSWVKELSRNYAAAIHGEEATNRQGRAAPTSKDICDALSQGRQLTERSMLEKLRCCRHRLKTE